VSASERAAARAPVAVVIVSWNAAEWLPGCLASLDGLVRPPREVVVVDAGSHDGSAEWVRRHHPRVDVIACRDNVGFCRGNNLGIAATSSPWVLVLNPDTELEPDFLEQLLPAFDDPRVGIASGKLLRFDRETIDSAGQLLSRSRRPIDRGYGEPDRGQYDADATVFGACGAAALYRRSMLEAIADPGGGYFDEAFFAFGEDLDLAWRAARAGWSAVYRHRALGYHARGGSSARRAGPGRGRALLGRSAEVRYHVLKNRYLTILRKDTPGAYLARAPFIWSRDLALVLLVATRSPGVLVRLWRERGVFRGALARRRLDAGRPRHHVEPGAGPQERAVEPCGGERHPETRSR
jgi:GT2 family glycosyltransferase